jgi:uncharacterized protein (TIGR03083 family)
MRGGAARALGTECCHVRWHDPPSRAVRVDPELSGARAIVRAVTDHAATYGLVRDFDPFARIEADTSLLADAAEGRLDAPVPSCPGWSVADLLWHLQVVQRFWAAVVGGRVLDPSEIPEALRPTDDAELVPGLRSGVAQLIAALQSAGPNEPCWTWSTRKDAGFVVRHQVHEAAVHRWDGEHAVGRETPLDQAAAADGVEEFLQFSTPFREEDAAPVGGRLVLVATDVGLRWAVEEDAAGTARWERITEPGTDAAAVLQGPAADLLLYLHKRRPAAELDVAGDVRVAERFAQRNFTG